MIWPRSSRKRAKQSALVERFSGDEVQSNNQLVGIELVCT